MGIDELDRSSIDRVLTTTRGVRRRIELPFLVAMEDDVPAADDDAQQVAASAALGGIWPAAWSFMLALCSCGLVSSLTMIHLGTEPEAGRVLDPPTLSPRPA